jgi:Holliday junction DNA helicase RuvA
MYAWASGRVAWIEEDALVLICQGSAVATDGIGLRIRVLPSVISGAREGEHLELYLHHLVREDAETLVGFDTRDEERLFSTLLDVSGVGPKVALSLLGTHGAPALRRALVGGDELTIAQASGVGRRLAARIIVELGEKIAREAQAAGEGSGASGAPDADLEAALRSLGFPPRDAKELVAAVAHDASLRTAPLADRLRAALKERS